MRFPRSDAKPIRVGNAVSLLLIGIGALLATLSPSMAGLVVSADRQQTAVLEIGSRLELFVDRYLIDHLEGTQLKLHEPNPAEMAIKMEGKFGGYSTVIKDGQTYRMYYGAMYAPGDGEDEVTCYAESSDGIHWSKPELRLFEVHGTRANNVVLAGQSQVSHTFSPFLDTRPGIPPAERLKALGGMFTRRGTGFDSGGLKAFASADGILWKQLQDKPVINHGHYPFHTDTDQPSAFWSESEGLYVCYIRMWLDRNKQAACCDIVLGDGCKICDPHRRHPTGKGYRWIGRTASKDFINWSKVLPMDVGEAPVEQFYHNQTHPYFRAPHIYVALPTRIMTHPIHRGLQAVTDTQVRELLADPEIRASGDWLLASPGTQSDIGLDFTDTVLLTSRGRTSYKRTFPEGFIRPGIGVSNWTNRANYSVLGIVPTSEREMSVYMMRDTLLPSKHIRRYTLRTDGFISVNAPYAGGEMVTKVFRFSGKELLINYSTSAAGSLRVEIQDKSGQVIPGYSFSDCAQIIGDEIARVVSWGGDSDLAKLAGRPVRLRFAMKDSDLYSVRFR